MQKLEAASGAEFDKTFLDVFTKHHQMAIDIAKEEVKKGTRQEVQEKARELIEKQGKDIKEMQQMKETDTK